MPDPELIIHRGEARPVVTRRDRALAAAPALDRASSTRAVIEFDGQTFAQTATYIDAHGSGQPDELGRQQDAEVIVAHAPIRRKVLAFDIGVDRHLSDLASTGGPDEVDRHGAATFDEQDFSVWGDVDVHRNLRRW